MFGKRYIISRVGGVKRQEKHGDNSISCAIVDDFVDDFDGEYKVIYSLVFHILKNLFSKA